VPRNAVLVSLAPMTLNFLVRSPHQSADSGCPGRSSVLCLPGAASEFQGYFLVHENYCSESGMWQDSEQLAADGGSGDSL
jgi:hypothetical protein